MSRTRSELSKAALQELTVVGVGVTPAAHLGSDMEAEYSDALRELERQGLAYWPENEIPEVVFRPLVKFMAARTRLKYGKDYISEDAAKELLRMAVASPYIGEPVDVSMF